MSLKEKNCIPCEGGIPPLTIDECKNYLSDLGNNWQLSDGKKLTRTFHFVNFKHTMQFVNDVAGLAEAEGHHPEMQLNYGRCTIDIWSFAINGLSENDFILAAKINELM